jgi:hypothetical protein
VQVHQEFVVQDKHYAGDNHFLAGRNADFGICDGIIVASNNNANAIIHSKHYNSTAMSKQMEEPMTQMPVSHATTAVVPSSSTVSTTIVSAQMPTNVDDTLIGAIVGGIAGLLVIVAAIAWCVVIDRRRRLAPDRDHGHAMSDVRDAGPVYSSVRPVSNIYDDVDGVRAQQM